MGRSFCDYVRTKHLKIAYLTASNEQYESHTEARSNQRRKHETGNTKCDAKREDTMRNRERITWMMTCCFLVVILMGVSIRQGHQARERKPVVWVNAWKLSNIPPTDPSFLQEDDLILAVTVNSAGLRSHYALPSQVWNLDGVAMLKDAAPAP